MYNRNKRRATFLTSKITYDRTAKNDVPRVNSRKFHFPLVQQCVQSRCRKSVRFAGLEYYGFDPVIMETAFVTLCGVECASRIFSRENCTDGWVFARSKVSRFQPSKVVLCCVVLCRSIVRYSRVYTRNALRRVDFNAAQLYTQLWCNSFDNSARVDNKTLDTCSDLVRDN